MRYAFNMPNDPKAPYGFLCDLCKMVYTGYLTEQAVLDAVAKHHDELHPADEAIVDVGHDDKEVLIPAKSVN